MIQHEQRAGYYYNYMIDASYCYWAARMLELNYKSTDEKDQMLDRLLIMRLRKLADDLVNQAVNGLKADVVSASEKAQIANLLAGEHTK